MKASIKNDVYSFGVVLLELITGCKALVKLDDEVVNLVRWVKMTISKLSRQSNEDYILALVDSRLNGYPVASVITMFKIAILCVRDESDNRPTMREVVHLLISHPHIFH